MLSLLFDVTLTATGLLTFTDVTPAASLTYPDGYGAPNISREDSVLIGIVGRQTPGTYRFGETLYADYLDFSTPEGRDTFSFQLNTDGLYNAWVLCISRLVPALTAPAGTLWLASDGRILRKLTKGTLLSEELILGSTSYDELRTLSPNLLGLADFIVSRLYYPEVIRKTDLLLLEYVRQSSRNRPSRGEDYSASWLQATATLESISVLEKQNRFPEAATQLVTLQRLLGQHLVPSAASGPVSTTDWISEQTK